MTRDEALKLSNEMFMYDSETGHLRHKECKYRPIKEGMKAGNFNQSGYLQVKIKGYSFTVHRICWYLFYGDIPSLIDHINGVRDDNRIVNLRAATHSQNGMNRPLQSDNTSGFKGVTFHKECNKYKAQIKVNKVYKYLGLYKTPEEAHQAYLTASKEFHGEFSHG